MQLNNVITSIIQDFVTNGVLFTALDVTEKVKEQLPLTRHREVRDEVRQLFTTDIEPNNYTKTPINVTLADGSTATALLYHPLSDMWDLDQKYDDQKRQRSSTSVSTNQSAVTPTVFVSPPLSTLASAPPITNVVTPSLTLTDAKSQWNKLFNNQPSLFPRK